MKSQLKQRVQAYLHNKPLTTNLANAIENTSELESNLLKCILDSEKTESFFQQSHMQETIKQLEGLTYEPSTNLSRIVGLIEGKTEFHPLDNTPLIQDTADACAKLLNNGFYEVPYKLPSASIQKIKQHLKSVDFTTKRNYKKLNIKNIDDLSNISEGTAWIENQQKALECPEVQEILMDNSLLHVIQEYLQAPPIHVQCSTWWSKPSNKDDLSLNSNAQMFHQDKEYIKFLKVFIYLTDVNKCNGPHQYIAGSHRDAHLHTPKGYSFSDRISEETIFNSYESSRLKTFTGEQGTIIIEDTSGFHRGLPLESGARLMLQFEFACSLYFNSNQPFTKQGLTSKYIKFLEKNHRYSQNYNDTRYKSFLKNQKQQHLYKTLKNFARKIIKP